MGSLNITIQLTDYAVKRDTVLLGNVKKLADGSVVFVTAQGLSQSLTIAEMEQITNFMKTL